MNLVWRIFWGYENARSNRVTPTNLMGSHVPRAAIDTCNPVDHPNFIAAGAQGAKEF